MSVPSCGMERCEAALPPSESGRWPSETMSRADMLRIAVVRSSVSVVVFVFNTLLLLSVESTDRTGVVHEMAECRGSRNWRPLTSPASFGVFVVKYPCGRSEKDSVP